ncbi:MAG: hypothetical protein FWG99_01710 [Treponema sp.]|nr:hypothetical protein [Treponema sp.]
MKLNRFACFVISLLLFSPALYSQDFSFVEEDLEQLENLITGTLLNMEEQQKLLEDLHRNLSESGNLIETYENIITEQEKLLQAFQVRLNEMSETYRMQSALSAKYEKTSKFWRNFTLIAIPVTAILSGGAAVLTMR